MRKYLKYDLKSNKKFFISTLMIFVIFFISVSSVKLVGSFNVDIEINSTIYTLETILILVLVMALIWFIFSSFHKEFYSKRSILTFSLPISYSKIILSKVLVINLFYLVLLAFVLFINMLIGEKNPTNMGEILFFLCILCNFLVQLILFAICIDRFKNRRKSSLLSLLLFPITIIILIFIRDLEKIWEIFDIFTYGYYFILAIFLFFINQKYIRDNFDLSWKDFYEQVYVCWTFVRAFVICLIK